jgi:hypothetical protein
LPKELKQCPGRKTIHYQTITNQTMKHHFILFFVLFYIQTAFAQFPLEHTYEAPLGTFNRVLLPGDGEKYYYSNPDAKKIYIFNADHTPWKTISLPSNIVSLNYLTVFKIFGTKYINTDNLLELSLQYFGKDSNNSIISFSGLINENNDVIIPNYVYTIRLTNGQEKLISNSDVYALPGLVLEHSYPEPYIDYFDTGTPACNGGYFININYSTSTFKLYNVQHQFVKNLPVPVISPGFNIDYARYTDDFGDGSTDFKYTYSETDYNNKLRNIYVKKEDGTTLFFKQYSTNAALSYPNFFLTTSNLFLAPKFFITVSTQDSFYTEFYTLPSFIKEKELCNAIYFDTEPGVAKFGQNYLRASDTSAKLFNQNDWSVYQEFIKPTGEIWEFKNASKYIFDADSEFELLNNETNGGTKRAIVRNMPDQSILFQESGFELGDVSILPGLGNKLICIAPGEDPNKSLHNVYTLPSSTPVSVIETSKEQLAVSVSPNPSSSGSVGVNFEQIPVAPIDIRVFNAQGMLMQQLKLPATEQVVLPATCFPTQGLYFVSIASGDWKAVAKLIRD